MKRAFFTIILLFGILSSPAQVIKCNISKAYAYFTVTLPGTQRVDENGNRVPPIPVVARFIYLECDGIKKPEIRSVSYNDVSVPLTIIKIAGSAVSVGKRFENEKEIVIRLKKGNTFYKLELQPPNEKPWGDTACKNIIIKLNAAGKICSYKVPAESQLYTLPMY